MFTHISVFCFFVITVAHSGSVRGVAFDGLNQLVITAGADCSVKFWKFKSQENVNTLTLPVHMAHFILHRERYSCPQQVFITSSISCGKKCVSSSDILLFFVFICSTFFVREDILYISSNNKQLQAFPHISPEEKNQLDSLLLAL